MAVRVADVNSATVLALSCFAVLESVAEEIDWMVTFTLMPHGAAVHCVFFSVGDKVHALVPATECCRLPVFVLIELGESFLNLGRLYERGEGN